MKLILTFITLLSCSCIFSQEVNNAIFNKIDEKGKSYVEPIKKGEIEFLRNVDPPKDSWLFPKLLEYKKNIGSKNIMYGSIIMPSASKDSNLYSYNLFAYNFKKEIYYFVAIVSYKVSENNVMFQNSYLFTEDEGLNSWWRNTFSFYESKEIKNIPEKFIFPYCPPPPKNF